MITVSILPQKFMLKKIVGDNFEISCMLNEGNNPEAYEPSMTHLMNIEHSMAYFCIGYIGFEDAIVGKAHINNPDLKIYNNSKGINVIRGTHFSPEGSVLSISRSCSRAGAGISRFRTSCRDSSVT